MSFRVLLLTVVTVGIFEANAQSESDRFIEQIVESIAENSIEELDYSELVEQLHFYQKKPININRASQEQLQQLVFLSPMQIDAILNYRIKNGKFVELFELQLVDGLHEQTAKTLAAFCTVKESINIRGLTAHSLITKGKSDLIFTYGQIFQRQEGYRSDHPERAHYLGNSFKLLSRYRYSYGSNLSLSLTMEKDPGEPMFSANQPHGFDFYSGNIAYKGKGAVRKVVLGDYSLQFGQGLSLWSGLSLGKSAAVGSITKNNNGLKPYSSTNESLFLRGIATTLQYKKVGFTPFVSYRFVDGAIDTASEQGEISSLPVTGLHRTASELTNKNQVAQLIYGSNLQFSHRRLRLGTTVYSTRLDKEFKTNAAESDSPVQTGNLNTFSFYYNYTVANLYLFGEMAQSAKSGFAVLNGAVASLSRKASLVLIQRNYQKDYQSFFNQAMAEGSKAANERGFYAGLIITPQKRSEINLYVDWFQFPHPKYRVDAPSSGYEILSQISHSFSKTLKVGLRYRFERKEENDEIDNAINFLSPVTKQNYRFEISTKISNAFQLRNRVELVDYKKESNSQRGFLTFQDIVFNPMASRFSGNCRLAVFNTPGFDSRFYAYENDVLYSYYMPAMQNRGSRFYVNGKFRVNKSAEVSCKYAVTTYADLEEIGSGLDKIAGNRKSDLKLQLRLQF